MRIFISYANEDRDTAAEIDAQLRLENHCVFYDQESLKGGTGFNQRIREEVESSDLLIFLISPYSVDPKRFALTEFEFANNKWSNLNGRVLPVYVAETPLQTIPPPLRALQFVRPNGSLAAKTVARVAEIEADAKRQQEQADREKADDRRRVWLTRLGVTVAIALVVVVLVHWLGPTPPQPEAPTIKTFTANPPEVDNGQDSNLEWTIKHADQVVRAEINPGKIVVTGWLSQSVTPKATTTYTLTIYGPGG